MTRWEKLFYGALALLLILGLASCSTVKTVVDSCRDGLCR